MERKPTIPSEHNMWGTTLTFDPPPRLWKSRGKQWMVKVEGRWRRLAMVLAEALLGRPLYSLETLYFVDGNPLNCTVTNLVVMFSQLTVKACPDCGEVRAVYPSEKRKTDCCRKCWRTTAYPNGRSEHTKLQQWRREEEERKQRTPKNATKSKARVR